MFTLDKSKSAKILLKEAVSTEVPLKVGLMK